MLAEGSVAFVTGAGSGLGRATAIAFARAGSRVCVADIDLVAAEETAHAIATQGEVHAVEVDVTNEASVSAAIGGVIARWDRLDYAFNNAGIRGGIIAAHEMSLAEFRRVLDINVMGVFLCQREELRVMYASGRGAIVNMASSNGFVPTDGSVHYTASKHAVIGITKAAAYEAARRGIRVNAVAPGTIETPLNVSLAGSEQAMRDKYTPDYPLRRLGQPEEISDAVMFLCGEGASFIVGHTLVVDGGAGSCAD